MKIEICLTKEELEVILILKNKHISVPTYIRQCIRISLFDIRSELKSKKINAKTVAKKIEELESEIALLKSVNNSVNSIANNSVNNSLTRM